MYSYLIPKPAYNSPAMHHRRAQSQRSRTGGTLRSWFQSAVIYWKQRRMAAALDALDDRTLMDIGICRQEIGKIVAKLDYRELRMTPLASSTARPKEQDMRLLTA